MLVKAGQAIARDEILLPSASQLTKEQAQDICLHCLADHGQGGHLLASERIAGQVERLEVGEGSELSCWERA